MNEEKYKDCMKNRERSCILYGACGMNTRGPEPHKITLYGLHCLNKGKKQH
ncbi:MAG: hypothetical protein GX568_05265 [Candidatus Gastranaerophilales bacterium]|nr:hypothetical protein [Candidatus Gastranaerophilales bacterium]